MSERLAPEQADSLPDVPEPAENPYLFGHAEHAAHVASAYRTGKLHHALLLTGPKGIGKATFAFHIAHHLLSHPRGEDAPETFGRPDPSSALSRQVASGAHPAVLHLTRPYDERAKKFKSAITVDEVRRVGRFLSLRAHDDSYRVVIVDPADEMNRNAANALLKSLEEPPARAIFLLVSHSPGGLLPTIRSRCQVLRLAPLSEAEIGSVLNSFGTGLPDAPEARRALLDRAGGSARQAILLAEHGGFDITEAADQFVGKARRDPLDAYKLADVVTGRDQTVTFEILNDHLLEKVARAAADAAAQGEGRRAARLAELWDEANATIRETDTYNLDKRQHVVGLLNRIGEALSR
ncbi:DNA polymerase III subunit delta' [Mesorhizobium australicum]|uniref:DNA polymerase III, delta prime subunit n=1 Tax=Mesorhizobium australicum TaxID=536018 RepID=A0A1X7PAV2_9HYPH|nr:DNA polymerase III subunit delta' [Mesorhizobium australicum]SMH48077.1 DNA polymerase III, delta prime subunit [Mesorhizobium australicum]